MSARRFLVTVAVTCVVASGAPATAGAPAALRVSDPPSVASGRPEPPGLPKLPLLGAITREVAPGVTYTRWRADDSLGPVRVHLLTIDLNTPGVSLDQAHRGSLRHRATTPRILKPDSAVAGVNGDFYALSGVPRGLAVDRQRGLLHGRVSGWNSAFYLDRAGRPRIDTLPIKLSIRQRPELTITGLNSPYAEPGGIVAYTPDWGRTAGRLVTQGQRHRVRAVVVRHGRVRSSSAKLPSGTKVRGLLLIGRDAGARQLRRLRIGDKVSLRSRVPGRPRMAISGNGFLVRGGEIAIHNDQVLNPRTGVGIDENTGEVLLVMVEGRVDHSRGYTTIEFAQLMIDLGAEAAVNFDGGGSATMVATRANGSTGVVNVPPSYELREVSNALEVLYQAP